MDRKQQVSLDEIIMIINDSLKMFYDKDSILLEYKTEDEAVAERCMVFRIGWYLRDRIRELSKFNGTDVDCEYNRNFNHPKSMYIRTLEKIQKKNVIPDLLVHKRKTNNRNLLVIEFKKGNPPVKQKQDDEMKLAYFTDSNEEYGYDYGLYIELYKKKAKIKVYQNGEHKSHLDYIFEPVKKLE